MEPHLTYLSTGVLDTAFDSQVYQLLLNLQPRIWIQHYCLEPAPLWKSEKRIEKTNRIAQEIPITSIRMTPFVGRFTLRLDARQLRRHLSGAAAKTASVIHARGCVNSYRALYALRRLRTQPRLITDFRGTGWDEIRRYGQVSWRRWVEAYRSRELQKIEEFMARASDGITCVSHAFAEYLAGEYDVPVEKIIVVPSVVDTSLFCFDRARREYVRERMGIGSRPVLIYSGSLAGWQQPEETVALFERIRAQRQDALLLFLTRAEDEARTLLQRRLPAGSFKVLCADHDEVCGYLCAADIGLLLRDGSTTNRVAAPIKFAEYLVCGLPVVITPGIGDTERHLRDLGAGCVLSDMDAMPDDVDALFLEGDERQRLAVTAAEIFGMENNIKKLLRDVYRFET